MVIISDIHANFPAFEAVINDMPASEKILFLGDVANFGPHPSECVDMLRELDCDCIQGNHDLLISDSTSNRNFWDEWSRTKLSQGQLNWLAKMPKKRVLFNSILAVHGSYDVDYDILPCVPRDKVEKAFSKLLFQGINSVWFGHYHYGLEFHWNGMSYTCIRPVGHHRDKDTRASYYVYKAGILSHRKVEYDVERTVFDIEQMGCLRDEFKAKWISFLRTGYSEELLQKDIKQIDLYKRIGVNAETNMK